MPNLELQVPQLVEHRLRGTLLLARRGFGGEKHEVEIAERRHLAASRPAKADDRQAFDRLLQNRLGDEVIGEPNELVVEERSGACRGTAIARLVGEAPRDLRAPILESVAKGGGRFATELLAGLERREPVG